jgi:hypothetical protein
MNLKTNKLIAANIPIDKTIKKETKNISFKH